MLGPHNVKKLADANLSILGVLYLATSQTRESALRLLLKNQALNIIQTLLDTLGDMKQEMVNSVEMEGEQILEWQAFERDMLHTLPQSFPGRDKLVSAVVSEHSRATREISQEEIESVQKINNFFESLSSMFLVATKKFESL